MGEVKNLAMVRVVPTLTATVLTVMALGSHPVAAAEPLPQFDLEMNCRSAGQIWGGTGQEARSSCVVSEGQARNALERLWSEAAGDDKTNCSLLIRTGGQPSYVELLSCIEMAREARLLRSERANGSSDLPVGGAIQAAPRWVKAGSAR